MKPNRSRRVSGTTVPNTATKPQVSHPIPKSYRLGSLLFMFLGMVLLAGDVAAQSLRWVDPNSGRRVTMRKSSGEVRGIVIWGNTANASMEYMADNTEMNDFRSTMPGFAIIATSYFNNMHYDTDRNAFQTALNHFATTWNQPEILNVPWLPMGWSNGGNMAYGFNMWKPEKVIAFAMCKGGVFSTSTQSAAARKTPGILIYGRSDTSTRTNAAWDGFNNNRSQGALWTIAADSGGHVEGDIRRIVLPYFREIYRLRYPHGQSFLAGPVPLRDLTESEGWLADNQSWSSGFTDIYRYDQAPKPPREMSWLPNRRMASIYRSWASFNRISNTHSGNSGTLTAPSTLSYNVTLPNGAWSLAEFYEGDRKIAEATPDGEGGNIPGFTTPVSSRNIYCTHAVVTRTDGTKSVTRHQRTIVKGAASPAALEVTRGFETIAVNGVDGIPSTAAGAARLITYKLTNIGMLPLTLAPPVVISGQSNCAVSIPTQPSGSELPDMYHTSLILSVTPTSGGLWSFNVSVPTVVPEGTPRQWTVTGVATGGTTTTTLTAVADTYLNNTATTTNYGSETSIRLNNRTSGGGASVQRGLLRFDLSSIPDSATVNSATLLFVKDNNVGGTVNIVEATGSWEESTATWSDSSNRFGATSFGSATAGTTSGAAVPDLALNASGATKVQEWVSNPLTNNGFGITTDANLNNSFIGLRSREHATASHHPRITLNYSAPAAIPLMAVTRNSVFAPQAGSNTVNGTEAGLPMPLDFQVQNLGGAELSVSNVTLGTFSNCGVVRESPASFTVSPSGSGLLRLAVTPSGSGVWSFVVTVATNDPAKNPYVFTVTGNALPRFTVTLDKQGGSDGTASVRAALNEPMPEAAAPYRPGYRFDGYFEFQNGAGKQYYTDNMESVRDWDVSDAATLYAQWTLLPPAAPEDFMAVLNGNSIELSWTNAPETVTVSIMRSLESGGPYTVVDSINGSTFLDSTVATATRYFYVLVADNAAGTSDPSEEVTELTPVPLPFADDFESLLPGDLLWQNNWDAMGATVQDDVVHAGQQAVRIDDPQGYIRRAFGTAETEVWTDFRIIPEFAADDLGHLYPDASALMYFNLNGNPVVYDGQTPQVLNDISVTPGQWVRVTVHSNHATRTWNLYLNGVLQASGLDFTSNAHPVYRGMSIEGAGDSVVYVDDVRIGMSSPFGGEVSPSTIIARGPISFSHNGSPQGPSGAVVAGSTGSVTFAYRGTGATSYGPSANKPVNVGTYEVVATVVANDDFASATSAPYAFTISPAAEGAPDEPLAAMGEPESAADASSNQWAKAEGGEINQYVDELGNAWTVHVFTASGESGLTVSRPGRLEYLVVGGGGAGGITRGGGGGAGGVLTGSVTVEAGTIPVTVGAGAKADNSDLQNGNGANSEFSSITTLGGGRGGRWNGNQNATIGGSGGGGGGFSNSTAQPGTAGQGNAGGNGKSSGGSEGAGGGGGASEAGQIGGHSSQNGSGGKGGDGLESAITGEARYYGGGGGGMANSTSAIRGMGGLGGGGAGATTPTSTAAQPGQPNTGGGGGGGGTAAGDGGSGVVAIRYQSEWAKVDGGETNIFQDEEGQTWKTHTFTNVGPGEVEVTRSGPMQYLIVGGGGAGGRVRGGGGGGGGVKIGSLSSPAVTLPFTIGAGGLGGSGTGVGEQTTLGSAEVIGGGNGGRHINTANAGVGGSGGGGGGNSNGAGAAGTPGLGFNGGNGASYNAGGGGGGGEAGFAASAGPGNNKGGDGLLTSFTGTPVYFAGGGGGCSDGSTTNAPGGLGGGGQGARTLTGTGNNPTAGAPNTGGGGGGAGNVAGKNGGDGGSGILIIRYKIARPTIIVVE